MEKKRYVTVGKKTHVDYVFELDLKQDSDKIGEEKARIEAEQEAKK